MLLPSFDKGVDSPGAGRQPQVELESRSESVDVVGDDLVAELPANQHRSPHIGEGQVLDDLVKYLSRKSIRGPRGSR